jgi:hypothetical protein
VKRVLLLLSAAVVLASCSPEDGRVRSSGPGADTGNRTAQVQIHAGSSEAYYGTPDLNPKLAAPSAAAKK